MKWAVGQVSLWLDLTAQRSLCGVAIFQFANDSVARCCARRRQGRG